MEGSNDRTTVLRRFFAGLTEYAFCNRVGIADPPLVDYVSELLIRFVHTDRVFGLRGPTGRRLDQVSDMLTEAEARQGEAKRHVHRHIGDFTLFWKGVFPEHVERVRRLGGKDSLLDFRLLGKRSYFLASTIPTRKEVAPTPVLKRLSDEFDMCVYALGEVRSQLEHRPFDETPELFLD